MLRQTAYGTPFRIWGVYYLGLLLQPSCCFVWQLAERAHPIHPVGGKVPPTAVEARVRGDQSQVHDRELHQGVAKPSPSLGSTASCRTPVSIFNSRRRPQLRVAPSRSHRECNSKLRPTPTEGTQTPTRPSNAPEQNPVPDPAPAPRTTPAHRLKSCRATWRSHLNLVAPVR